MFLIVREPCPMILACPNCTTRFQVPDGALGDGGRKVRCASCRHVWHAGPADAVQEQPAPRQPARPASAMRPAAAVHREDDDTGGVSDDVQERMKAIRQEMMSGSGDEEDPLADDENGSGEDGVDDLYDDERQSDLRADRSEDDPAPDDDLPDGMADVLGSIRAAAGEAGVDVDDADDLSLDSDDALSRMAERQRRSHAESHGRLRSVVMTGFWALLAAVWLGVPTTLLLFPDQVRSAWPASQVLYDFLGDVRDVERFREEAETLTPPITETPEVVAAYLNDDMRTEERGGETALVLSGFVENKGQRSARVPRLRIAILNTNGREIDSWEFDPPGRIITRGQTLAFEQVRAPIPVGANQVTVSVVEGVYSQTEAEING